MFFAEKNNKAVLEKFIQLGNKKIIDNQDSMKMLKYSIGIIESINHTPEIWDNQCEFNIKHIGPRFITELSEYEPATQHDLKRIFCMSYRFLCELHLNLEKGKELSMELQEIKNNIEYDDYHNDSEIRSRIIYASYTMPVIILKELINNDKISVFKNFDKKKKDTETLITQWDKELKEKEIEVTDLKNKLDEYKVGYNFVGLNQGFANLGKQKDKEAAGLFKSLIAMGILTTIPLITVIVFTSIGIFQGQTFGTNHLSVLIPIISIEVILIYFFRVILFNHKSVKAQKMQIELRQTLCQFIQSYAEYSVKIKEKDNKALEKFENLIFSGILSDSEKLPSTFDGLDQLTNLIKSAKSS